MNNDEAIQQLIYRSKRIQELMSENTGNTDRIELLRAELFYVNTQIEYRTKHGELF